MMVAAGYAAAVVVGVVMGLIGGGGAILTLPILVFAFGLVPADAAAHSLFIVGAASAVGAAAQARNGMVDYRAAARFALPAFLAIHVVRRALMPRLPQVLTTVYGHELTKDGLIMAVLAAAMTLSAAAMLRAGRAGAPNRPPPSMAATAARGLAVGALTGFVGAGGGFLLVPGLHLGAGLPMRRAVATSLFVIAANSLFAFTGDLLAGYRLDVRLLLWFTGLAVLGMVAGTAVSRHVPERAAKIGFAWFLVVLAVVIVSRGIAS